MGFYTPRIMKKQIKKLVYSKFFPDFLFKYYFDSLASKYSARLIGVFQKNKSFLEELREDKRAYWQARIDDVMNGPDNADIERVENAGKIIDNCLIMHNGIKVDPMSYYSYPLLQMLIDNKSVHEPQEEKVFQEVLKSLPKMGDKMMMELGAYWSFYSMWFLQNFPKADCFMVEPEKENLFYGKRNFQLNQMKGKFIQAGIGKKLDHNNNIITVDSICKQNKIEFLDILHSDIQGYEYEMLLGSEKLLSEKKVGYVFISTHSNELHEQCYNLLKNKYNMHLVASANLDESYSWDGILVMKNIDYPGIDTVKISKK